MNINRKILLFCLSICIAIEFLNQLKINKSINIINIQNVFVYVQGVLTNCVHQGITKFSNFLERVNFVFTCNPKEKCDCALMIFFLDLSYSNEWLILSYMKWIILFICIYKVFAWYNKLIFHFLIYKFEIFQVFVLFRIFEY